MVVGTGVGMREVGFTVGVTVGMVGIAVGLAVGTGETVAVIIALPFPWLTPLANEFITYRE